MHHFYIKLYCWFTVNLQFMTVTASFCIAVAVAKSRLFCIYVFDFALSTVAFSTCLSWKKSNCFWTSLSVCKGHSKFQSSSLLAWCLQDTWCIFSLILCLELVMKLVMKTTYSTGPWRIFRNTSLWLDIEAQTTALWESFFKYFVMIPARTYLLYLLMKVSCRTRAHDCFPVVKLAGDGSSFIYGIFFYNLALTIFITLLL